MNGKDEKIQHALTVQSNLNLPPEDRILGKAKAEMRRRKTQPAPVKKNTGWVVGLCSAAAAVVIAVVIGAGVFSQIGSPLLPDSGNKDSFTPAPDSPDSEGGGFYYSSGLVARKTDYAKANALYAASTGKLLPIPSSGELQGGAQIINADYTAYKNSQTNADVLIRCNMRVANNGGYDDLVIWFELTQDTYESNKEYLKLPVGKNVRYAQSHVNGEYVSKAYIQNEYGCMLSVMNPDGYNLNCYLQAIFGITEEGAI